MWVEKHGPSWRIRDQPDGRKVTLASGYRTKTAATHAMTEAKADRLRGDALVPRGGRMLLADWVGVWQPTWEIGLKPSSAHSEPARIRNHILPLLGGYPLDEVDTLVVRWWIGQLCAGHSGRRPLAAKTVRNTHGLLHTILSAAVEARLVRHNPCTGKGLPQRVHREMRFLTEPEIARLVVHVPAHWRPLVLLLVATGLRWGEAAGLRIKWVDLLAKPPRLTVVQTLHELPTGQIVYTDPKTTASRRTVTFTAKTADALAGCVAGKGRDELVFTAPRGGPARIRNFRRGWVKWCQAAGLGGLRVHDLRHTHAALLISAGVPLTGVQRRLGHSSIAVTSDLYGHLLPVVDEGILAAIDAALAMVDIDAEVTAELADV